MREFSLICMDVRSLIIEFDVLCLKELAEPVKFVFNPGQLQQMPRERLIAACYGLAMLAFRLFDNAHSAQAGAGNEDPIAVF